MVMVASSDSAMEGLQLDMMKAFIGLATGLPGEQERLRNALAAWPAKVEAKAAKRTLSRQVSQRDTTRDNQRDTTRDNQRSPALPDPSRPVGRDGEGLPSSADAPDGGASPVPALAHVRRRVEVEKYPDDEQGRRHYYVDCIREGA